MVAENEIPYACNISLISQSYNPTQKGNEVSLAPTGPSEGPFKFSCFNGLILYFGDYAMVFWPQNDCTGGLQGTLGLRVHLSESEMHGLLKAENQSASAVLLRQLAGALCPCV